MKGNCQRRHSRGQPVRARSRDRQLIERTPRGRYLFRRNGIGPDSTELKGDQPPAGIAAVSEQHLGGVSFGPHYGLKAAVAAGPKSAQQATSRGGKHSYPLWSTSTGKLSALIWPFTSVQKQSTWSPLIPLTVINGPPDRSRTRLPLRNAGMQLACRKRAKG